jgi:5-methylcytosine-specific restriction endonuclease McrA
MLCPRCNSIMGFMFREQFIDDKESDIIIKNEYLCQDCNSLVIETFKNDSFYSSEWIDFNG